MIEFEAGITLSFSSILQVIRTLYISEVKKNIPDVLSACPAGHKNERGYSPSMINHFSSKVAWDKAIKTSMVKQ